MYVLFGDTDFTARLAPALMGARDDPAVLAAARRCSAASPRSPPRRCSPSARATCTSAASPARTSTSRRSRSRCSIVDLALPRQPAQVPPGADRRAARAQLRDQGDDVHHGLRDGLVLHRRAACIPTWRPAGLGRRCTGRRAGRAGAGRSPRSPALFTILFTTFLTHPDGLWTASTRASSTGSASTTSPAAASLAFYSVGAGHDRVAGAAARRRSARSRSGERKPLFTRVPDLGLRRSRSPSTRGRARSSRGWSCTRCCRCVLLAGVGIQAIWEARGGLARIAGIAAAARRAVYVGVSSWWVNVDRGADPREFLVSTQSSTEVKEVADQVLALAASRGPGKPPLTVTVDAAEGATFPYAWYFRHSRPATSTTSSRTRAADDATCWSLTDAARPAWPNALSDYDCRQFDFRVWWVRDYGISRPPTDSPGPMRPALCATSPSARRGTPTGGMKEWLCVKKGADEPRPSCPARVHALAELVPLRRAGVAVGRLLDRARRPRSGCRSGRSARAPRSRSVVL